MRNRNVSKNRRSKQFVDAAVQGALVRRLAGHWIVFMVVSTILMLGLRVLSDPFQPIAMHCKGFLQDQLFFLLLMVCMTPIFLWDTVKLSNRFVGPVLRVHRALSDLNQGKEIQEINFRKGDFWQELADEVNCLLRKQQQVASGSAEGGTEMEEPAQADAVEV